MIFSILSETPNRTKKIGKKVAKLVTPGDIILFFGELGAGKTCFTQGIAEELKVKDYVNSPSYAIINEYQGKIPLYHFDLYRVNNYDEIIDLGYEEYFYDEGLTVVEWAEKIEKHLPKEYLKINITFIDTKRRKICFFPKGDHYVKLIEELRKDENIGN